MNRYAVGLAKHQNTRIIGRTQTRDEIKSGNINSKQNLSTQSTIPTLRPLDPETDKYEYNDYVSYLEEAVNDVRIRNIALSGPYGVGKSTILGNFKKKHDAAVFI